MYTLEKVNNIDNSKFNATAVILSGGKNSRMGKDKNFLRIGNVTLIEHIIGQLKLHFNEILISSNDKNIYIDLKIKTVSDLEKGQGPLMGIYSALLDSSNEINFITACDIPQLNMDFINQMIQLSNDNDIVIPFTGKDKFEPLFAIYKKSISPIIKELLDTDKRKISNLFTQVKTRFIRMPRPDTWYNNLNTHEDYIKYLKDQNLPF